MDNKNITIEDVVDARMTLKAANSLAVFGGEEFMDALDVAISVMDSVLSSSMK